MMSLRHLLKKHVFELFDLFVMYNNPDLGVSALSIPGPPGPAGPPGSPGHGSGVSEVFL